METKTLILVALIAGILIVAGIYFGLGRTTVTSQGQSQIKVEPDLLGVYFSVEYKDASAEVAKNKLADTVSALKNSLLDVVDEKEITTQSFSVQPNYIWNGRTQTQDGYIARQEITVKTTRIDKAGRIVDKGVDAGALVNWINFELSQEKQNEAKAQALEQASLDAKTKAEATVKGLGKRLGGVVSINANDYQYYPYRLYENGVSTTDAKQAAVDINPQDLEVSASVSVVYRVW